jgi:hypothetical protein
VDFVSLSYCRSADDVYEAREFLNSIGAEHTKARAGQGRGARGRVHRSAPLGRVCTASACRSTTLLWPALPAHGGPASHIRRLCSALLKRVAVAPLNPINPSHPSPQIIAKCETRQSLFNFRTLVDAADAIIISRGNLGLDVVPEKMAMVQKAMISTCAILGKTSIITRVVDTMIRTPRPTR